MVATEWETECPTYKNLQVKQNLDLYDVLNGVLSVENYAKRKNLGAFLRN